MEQPKPTSMAPAAPSVSGGLRPLDLVISCVTCALLSYALVAGALMSLATAYSIPLAARSLLLSLGLVCCLGTILYSWRHGWLVVMGLWALCLLWLYAVKLGPVEQGARVVYTAIAKPISSGYGVYFTSWLPERGAKANAFLLLWGSVLLTATTWCIHRRQSLIPLLLMDSIPLGLCLILVDTPPSLKWCLTYLCAVCLLLLTQASRQRSTRDGSRLVLLLLLPCLALILGLNRFLPPETYVRGGTGIQVLQYLVDFSNRFLPMEIDDNGALDMQMPILQQESLDIGPRRDSNATVMRIEAPVSGPIYLRGMTYHTYSGKAWELGKSTDYPPGIQPEDALTVAGVGSGEELVIHTQSIQSVIYTPYFLPDLPAQGEPRQDILLENPDRVREYSVTYVPMTSKLLWDAYVVATNADSYFSPVSGYGSFALDYYTQLPDSTRDEALALAERWGLSSSSSPQEIADRISRSAAYDLDTPRMPADSDFVLWFLEESSSGYCVHFASSAVVMLRALGYPARYATGYLAMGQEGTTVRVTAENAHAWAEVYTAMGWVPVEATPAEGVTMTMTPNPDRSEPTARPTTRPTAPPETSAPTEPSQDPTVPAETTAPTQPTDPGTVPAPSGSPDNPDAPSPEGSGFSFPWWILLFPAAIALFLLRRPATLALRRRGTEKHSRSAFLRRWSNADALSRQLGSESQLEDLALRARFSQHRMTAQDFTALAQWETQLRDALRTAPWHKRFLIRWIRILD